jgi:hypothetical protein
MKSSSPVRLCNWPRHLAVAAVGLALVAWWPGICLAWKPPVHAAASTDAKPEKAKEPAEAVESVEVSSSDQADPTVSEHVEELMSRKDAPWLGVATGETFEALTAQLALKPGVGLVILFVDPESPAAKMGLRKNDVLVEFDGQSLVHPAQLRKLVQAHQEGDEIALAWYRGGKQQTGAVKLGKTSRGLLVPGGAEVLKGHLENVRRQLKDLHVDTIIEDSLGSLDRKKIQLEIRHSLDDARAAVREALRNATNSDGMLEPMRKALSELSRSDMLVKRDATVTVRSDNKDVRSLVTTDDSGTIILVNQPKLHLTSHDKDGKLIFDGEIETADQQAKVPQDLWKRVEPLVSQMKTDGAKTAE